MVVAMASGEVDEEWVDGLGSGVEGTRLVTALRFHLPSVHSVRAIYTALQGVEGIVRADVSRTTAMIEHDGRATRDRLRWAVESAGYEVTEIFEDDRRLIVRNEE